MPPNKSSGDPCTDVQAISGDKNADSKDYEQWTKPTKIHENGSINSENSETVSEPKRRTIAQIFGFKAELVWLNIILLTLLQVGWVWTLLTFPYTTHKMTFVHTVVSCYLGGLGITAGVHRLWTHRSYKAKLPLQILLLLLFYSAGQNTIYDWVRDHRVHHKYTETDADPHNSNRGFFFAHFGWLMMKRHPEVIKHGRKIDMSDITNDPVVAFGQKYYVPLVVFLSFILPTIIPVYFWNEEWKYAIIVMALGRYPFILNITWSINSVAHFWGFRPYDRSIRPTDNAYVALGLGEGWHNYHHVFPWDYKAAEFGYYRLNFAAAFIDGFAKIGWAYDLKEPTPELVKSVMANKGDGSRPSW